MSKIYILYTTSTTEVMMSPSRQSLLTKRMLGFISPWIYETLKSCKKLILTTQGSAPEGKLLGDALSVLLLWNASNATGIQGNQLKQFSRKVSTLCIFQSSAQLLASLARVCKRQASQFQLQEAIRWGSNMLDWVTKCWQVDAKRKNQWCMKRGHVRNFVRNTYRKRWNN